MAELDNSLRMEDRWEELLQKFRERLIVDEGLAENTVSSYCSDLKNFFGFIREQELQPEEVDMFVITDFLEYCRRGEYAPRTVSRRLSTLHKFFSFLTSTDCMSGNPVEKMDRPGKGENFPNYLSEQEVRSLLDEPDCDSSAGLRDRALLEAMYGAGLRVSEAVELEANGVDWERGELSVIGKGDKQRIVPIGREALKWLKRYGREIRNTWTTSGGSEYFFLTRKGTQITRQQIWQIVKKYAQQANLTEVTPHTLRHSFATHMLAGGADLRSLQKMLGHSDVGTTADIYVHLRDEVRNSHRDYHPRGR